ADYDNDGAVDVLVLRGAWLGEAGQQVNSLLKNDGKGRFRDVTFEVGLGEQRYPTPTAAWGDYNNDGHLDLYIGNENYPAQLFTNNGEGEFVDMASFAGVENNLFAKGVVWGDYDNDGFLDLYVSNNLGDNRLYRNNQNGTFTDVAPMLGVTGPFKSFPAWFWDYNNDGVLDLYVSSWWPDVQYVAATFLEEPHEAELPCLYEGDGKGGFRNVAIERKLTANAQPMGANFGDLDNDGWLDFYLGTGYPEYEALMPNLMYRNASGKGFDDVTMAGGFGHLQKGHGVAFGDLNNNGTQDLYIQMGGAYAGDKFGNLLFENPGFSNHWIGIKLVGRESNRSAIGTRIRVDVIENGKPRTIYKWVNSGGSFGANPLQQQIGLGKATGIQSIELYWPKTGKTQKVTDVPADQFIEITEGETGYHKRSLKSFAFAKETAN
ncbi:MAG: CRTAC1 family protein, partial [Planctomycetaceae bacterium]|nr:CRTAC1 family protein [Planctomycetaceae bacterium]